MGLLATFLANPTAGITIALGLVISLSVHEFAHAYAAHKLGDNTAEHLGRLTLNPLAHLDPVGTIALLLLGFGWGKPVPYDPRNLKRQSDPIVIALAGPLSNILIAALMGLALRLVLINPTLLNGPAPTILITVASINLFLAVFNLIPIPPLDGSRILSVFLSVRQQLQLEQYGFVLLLALVFFGQNLLQGVLGPIVAALGRLVGVPGL